MSYQFGSFPAASGFSTSVPSFGTTYGGYSGGFSGLSSGLTSAASPFAAQGFGAATQGFGAAAPVYSGFPTSGFGAQPAFSGNTFGAATTGLSGFGGLYSGVAAAPAAFGAAPTTFGAAPAAFGAAPTAFGGFPSGFAQATPTVFGGFPAQQFGQYPGFSTPTELAQNAFLAQAQQGDAQARGRQISKIEYGLGVPTMVPTTGNEDKLERTPSGNLPRREASRGELRTRSFSGQPAQAAQGGPNSMAAYLSQNSSLNASRAQAVAASTMSPRNLGAPTGHRGSNPREQVPW